MNKIPNPQINWLFYIVLYLLIPSSIYGQHFDISKLETIDTAATRLYIENSNFSQEDQYRLWGLMKEKSENSYDKTESYYFKKEVDAIPSSRNPEYKVKKYVRFSVYAANQYDLDLALKYVYKAEEIAEYENDDHLRGKVNHALGWYYAANCEYERANKTYDIAIEQFRSVGFNPGVKYTLLKKGLALQLINKNKEALQTFEMVKSLSKKPTFGLLSILIKSSFKNGDIDKTRKVLNEYFSRLKQDGNPTPNTYRYYIIKAIESNILGIDTLEENYLSKAQLIAKEKNYEKEEFGAFIRLGNYYLKKKNLEKAKVCFHRANDIVYDHLMHNRYNEPNEYLLQIAQLEGNVIDQKKYKALKKYYDEESRQKINVNNIIENNKKATLIRQKTEIQAQSQKIWTLTALGIIGIGLLLFSFFYYRKYVKLVRDLSHKNMLLDESVNEKQTLLQETHHRVKNNLQIIASLLNLQRKYTKDKKLTSALIDGRNRVKSMALIHQLLYQKKYLKGINVRNYVENLMSSLFSSLKADQENIKFTNNVQPLDLHEDTLLALGLIINEVVTNSLKYAFEEYKDGEIMISLTKEYNRLNLSISDNGKGMPNDFDINDKASFGYSLINSLSKKLNAKIRIINNGGTEVNMDIYKFIETE